MDNELLLKFVIGKRFYNTENLITKWVDESKKGLTLVLYVGKVRVASISENALDELKPTYSVSSRIPTVRKNLGTFESLEKGIEECESVAKFFISQLASEF